MQGVIDGAKWVRPGKDNTGELPPRAGVDRRRWTQSIQYGLDQARLPASSMTVIRNQLSSNG